MATFKSRDLMTVVVPRVLDLRAEFEAQLRGRCAPGRTTERESGRERSDQPGSRRSAAARAGRNVRQQHQHQGRPRRAGRGQRDAGSRRRLRHLAGPAAVRNIHWPASGDMLPRRDDDGFHRRRRIRSSAAQPRRPVISAECALVPRDDDAASFLRLACVMEISCA